VPWGRLSPDGRFRGENFREGVLKPALLSNPRVVVDLDGAEGDMARHYLTKHWAALSARVILNRSRS